jgi:hypothetical protein
MRVHLQKAVEHGEGGSALLPIDEGMNALKESDAALHAKLEPSYKALINSTKPEDVKKNARAMLDLMGPAS